MPFSDNDAMNYKSHLRMPPGHIDDRLPGRTTQVTPRMTLLAEAQNEADSEHFSGLPNSDRKVMRYILRGEYDRVGQAEAEAATPADDDDYPLDEEERERAGELVRRVHDGVEQLRQLDLLEQSRTRDTMGRGRSALILLPRKAASSLTVVFNGNQPMLALPIPLLNRFETHILLTRDPRRCFGLAGLPGLGEDYPQCVASLRKLIAHLGVQRVYCLGISAGGASAIKLGVDLQADGVLCFSGPTTLNLDNDPGADMSHYPQLTQLYRTDRNLGIDLGDYYRRAARRPGMLMVFGADHPRDSWLAERVADVEGVQLAEVKGLTGHKTYPWAIQHGFMTMLLERMFRLSPVGG